MEQLKQFVKQETGELFVREGRFRLVELGKDDAERWTDRLTVLRTLIGTNQPMYPNIERWFDAKVVPGLRSGERVAWVAYEGGAAIASAVLKKGGRSKFCHLRIHQDFQDMDLGQMFFTQMTMEARRHAREIHFSLPESLWYSKSGFFESFGFSCAGKSARQYRPGDTELSCSAPISKVWSSALSRLPSLASRFRVAGFSLDNKILISIKPKICGANFFRIEIGRNKKEIFHKVDRLPGGAICLQASLFPCWGGGHQLNFGRVIFRNLATLQLRHRVLVGGI